ALSRAFYWTFRALTGFPLQPGSADFRLMSRGPVDALNGLPERHRFVRGLVPWLGFQQTHVAFHAPARWAGRSKYTFRRSLRLAIEGVTSFNLYPLRFVAVLGLIVMALSVAYGVVTWSSHASGGRATGGWITAIPGLYFVGGLQLAALGIISEYLGRTLEQV